MFEREDLMNLDMPPVDELGGRSYNDDYFNKRMADVVAFVKEHTLLATPIEEGDIAHYKAAKKMRADLNNRARAVSQFRKEVGEFYLGKFNKQCKDIEDEIAKADALYKAVIDEYEMREGIGRFKNAAAKAEKPAFQVTITAPDEATFKRLVSYAKRNGCKVE